MNFLMVVPPGWRELPNATAFVQQHGEASLQHLINTNELGALDGLLGDIGEVPADKTLAEFRMFREGEEFRVWFRLVDL
jgi:hypothetical protein